MTRPVVWALAALVFCLVATANAGGYRFGTSDQAFYEPAIAMSANPALFPRDRVLLEAQMRWWLGDSLFGAMSHLTGGDLPSLFLIVQIATLLTLFAAVVALARSFGADWWTTAALVVLVTLRHRIARTGANSIEGYMQPRLLAFAFGLFAFAASLRRRTRASVAWTAAGAVVHTTTAFWFAVALGAAAAWRHPRRADIVLGIAAAVTFGLALVVVGPLASRMTMIDPAWQAVLDEKDYLYSARWPLYAWLSNLAYPAAIALIYRRRRRLGRLAADEPALVAGLVALVLVFLISVPLTEGGYALAVQSQANRVFWLLDIAATLYLAWWVFEDLGNGWTPRLRTGLVAALSVAAVARGYYVLAVEAHRPLIEWRLPSTPWMDAMTWLRGQPSGWHVLADPQHAWVYGVSVRVGAERDVLLEAGKDSALAIYDRAVAERVLERGRALQDFDHFTTADVRALARRYHLDVFVDRRGRSFALPVLYQNAQFVIYDLR